MSRSAKNLKISLPGLSKKTMTRKVRPLLNMEVQLREINGRMNLNIDFEKPQFIAFFSFMFENFFMQPLKFIDQDCQPLNNGSSGNTMGRNFLDKINRLNSLSERQHEIFEKLLRGLSNEAIAKEIRRKLSTVKNHLNEVYLKLGVPNRYVAIAQYRDLFENVKKLSSGK
jgi:DNA-binding CsgD family transcriptional regulator